MKSISTGAELALLHNVLATQPAKSHQSIRDAAASLLILSKDITQER
jgi:hypothetical protein